MDRENDEMGTPMMSPYAACICGALVGLGEAVGLALNLRDVAVLAEMRQVCHEIFEQADTAMQSKTEFN